MTTVGNSLKGRTFKVTLPGGDAGSKYVEGVWKNGYLLGREEALLQ